MFRIIEFISVFGKIYIGFLSLFSMAGTCNDCGADTWGRYRICPDCRKERKRKGSYSRVRNSSSGEGYFCNSCGYGWRSKKDFGSPAFCPRCREDDIIPYTKTPQYRRDVRAGIFVIVFIIFICFIFIMLNPPSNKTKSSQELTDQFKEECLSNNSFYYSQTCTPLESIQNHKSLCNADGMKPIIFLTSSGGNLDCYRNKIESDKLSESQKTEVLNCENFGGVPLITDKVNCIELTPYTQETNPQTTQNSNLETTSPEEDLIDSCITQFSNEEIFDLKRTNYQDDFSSASDWIKNNYNDLALTPSEHNINREIEKELPKEGYPIVITWGGKKVAEQVTGYGIHYCNENGII